MKTGAEFCAERGLDLSKESYSMEDLRACGLPMIVACICCSMTMSVLSPKLRVSDKEEFLCKSCAETQSDDREMESWLR